MLVEIPTRNDLPAYSQRVDLGETSFNLFFRYNERSDRWAMDLSDADGVLLVGGVPLLTGVPLLFNYKFAGKPAGDFVLYDREGVNKNAGRNDLGDEVKLYYFEAA